MNKYIKLTLCILAPLTVGAISGFATASSISTWFVGLNKPSFNPPNYLFGPVWTVLYLLMGISLFMVLQSASNTNKKNAIRIFIVQLFLNFCWSFLFFKYQQLGIALVEISVLWISILAMIVTFKKINTRSAYLQIPYLLWVSFATVLNASLWMLN